MIAKTFTFRITQYDEKLFPEIMDALLNKFQTISGFTPPEREENSFTTTGRYRTFYITLIKNSSSDGGIILEESRRSTIEFGLKELGQENIEESYQEKLTELMSTIQIIKDVLQSRNGISEIQCTDTFN